MAAGRVKEGGGMVAVRLRDLRRRRGMTQEDLAERAGVEQPQISAWEGGRRSPTMENVKKLARGFGMRDDELARELGILETPVPDKDGTHEPPRDIFDTAPLAWLRAQLEALPTAPGHPTFAEQLADFDRLSEDRRERAIRRIARDFLNSLQRELEEGEG